ncbi:hypothetical protein FHS57_002158 [Runella defluvii]|uniref:Uncharacterized protein n=1 Tax=Runella defluvii TaxID=370973 RepID=A0A7W6EQ57_9BACT|nr:hypothetical protein [Runella defluvii]
MSHSMKNLASEKPNIILCIYSFSLYLLSYKPFLNYSYANPSLLLPFDY